MTTLFLPSKTLLRERRAKPLPNGLYYRAYGDAEYLAAKVPVIPHLLERWQTALRHPSVGADVAFVLELPGIERRPGMAHHEELRATKLVLDAYRELWHLVSFAEFGHARYDGWDDVTSKIDLRVMRHGWPEWQPLQVKVRDQADLVDVKPNGCTINVRFAMAGCDRTRQPYVPTDGQYHVACERIDALFSQTPIQLTFDTDED